MAGTPGDVTVSATLASELLDAIDFARHHAEHHGNRMAVAQLAALRIYLAYEIDAALQEFLESVEKKWNAFD